MPDNVGRTLFNLFGERAGAYIHTIDKILPKAANHIYRFWDDETVDAWVKSQEFDVAACNAILASELIDKSHLAATTALFRSKQWVAAACFSYEGGNFVGWASAVRGLAESAGDILDGLMNVGPSLAENHTIIRSALLGRLHVNLIDFSEIDATLDHYVLAKWMRGAKGNVLKAKENAEYIGMLERGNVPKILEFYRRLCGVTHPSSLSIDYLFKPTKNGMRLEFDNERQNIDSLILEYPEILPQLVVFSCNPALIILRVLHTFKYHPNLKDLKRLDWNSVPVWATIERSLKI